MNVNVLNVPNKTWKIVRLNNETQLHTTYKKPINKTEVKTWRKKYHTNNTQKKADVAILILDKADAKARKVIRDKEEHVHCIKGINSSRHNSP